MVIFLSCVEKKDDAVSVPAKDVEESELVQGASNIPLSIDEVRLFLEKNETRIVERGAEIVFIEKAHFGIPGGDNWIVRLNDRWILIYVINGNKIEKRFGLTSFNSEEYSNFDIMRYIPSRRIGSSSSSIGDFNNNGMDEIFEFGFYGLGNFILIWGYDLVKDDFISYCEVPFRLIDIDNGPAPVEFMSYRGIYGFKVFFYQGDVAGGPDYVPFYHPDNNKWLFYTWDGEKREYVQVGEVIEEGDSELLKENEIVNSEIDNNEL
jgi:hypothetical protein